jgi:hypothetical protein
LKEDLDYSEILNKTYGIFSTVYRLIKLL